ncbi:MAG: MmgE/PrpD family protein [Dehalococcoidia bacterium]|nr:MmgE/PrpD family protein [Dehalococcoidia bacterium]MDW8119226.1 MmgE/PrpD family protein [Chloroflexota bacterium]
MPAVTETLARFVSTLSYEDIPPEALRIGKEVILDCLGVALAGSVDGVGRIVKSVVRQMGGKPEATVIGAPWKTSAAQAALANGAMGHALDYDDMGMSVGHPTVPVLPAVLGLGEHLHASGKEVLTAFIAGLEVEGKLAAAGQELYSQGFHSTSIYGTVGAAAACARLLHLPPAQTQMALGIAASLSAGLKDNFGTMTKPLHPGHAAWGGVMAALLAREGFTARADVLEAPYGFMDAFAGKGRWDAEKAITNLGSPFHILHPGITLKKYPCCGGNHRVLDALYALRQQTPFTWEQVDRVVVESGPVLPLVLQYTIPQTGYQGKFSLHFNVAAALVLGHVVRDTFTDAVVRDPRIQEMMRRVEWKVVAETGDILHQGTPVTVYLKDGRVLRHPGDFIKGDPQHPLSRQEILDKFSDNARLVLSRSALLKTIDLVLGLEGVEDVTRVMRPLAVRLPGDGKQG